MPRHWNDSASRARYAPKISLFNNLLSWLKAANQSTNEGGQAFRTRALQTLGIQNKLRFRNRLVDVLVDDDIVVFHVMRHFIGRFGHTVLDLFFGFLGVL